MSEATVTFDHVHLVSADPQAAAAWYEQHLGGRILRTAEVLGAPQVYLAFGDAQVIVRGKRPGESPVPDVDRSWGVDHFGMHVAGDFDAFCDRLSQAGVRFTLAPERFNPTTRIAFVEGPDGVSIELVQRTG